MYYITFSDILYRIRRFEDVMIGWYNIKWFPFYNAMVSTNCMLQFHIAYVAISIILFHDFKCHDIVISWSIMLAFHILRFQLSWCRETWCRVLHHFSLRGLEVATTAARERPRRRHQRRGRRGPHGRAGRGASTLRARGAGRRLSPPPRRALGQMYSNKTEKNWDSPDFDWIWPLSFFICVSSRFN